MILLVSTDLIFTTRVRAEAAAAGATVSVARSVEALRSKLGHADGESAGLPPAGGSAPARPSLVIVDLDGPDSVEAVRVAAAVVSRVVAYVSHVHADLARAAREAGAGEVMARSAFVTRLPQLVQEART